MHDEEINSVLYTLLQKQDEMLVLMKAIHTRLPLPENQESDDEEIWLSPKEVQALLYIEPRTFYRMQAKGQWKRKRIGGKWYYLKSSVLRER